MVWRLCLSVIYRYVRTLYTQRSKKRTKPRTGLNDYSVNSNVLRRRMKNISPLG